MENTMKRFSYIGKNGKYDIFNAGAIIIQRHEMKTSKTGMYRVMLRGINQQSILNVKDEKMKPLPVIGGYTIIK